MEVTETRADGLERELKVVIPAATLDARLNAYLDDMRGKVKLKGFRPGKVPLSHLKKVYGRSAMAEIINDVISESVRDAVEKRDEKPALQPDVDVDEAHLPAAMSGQTDLAFDIKYEVLPEIRVEGLDTIAIERPVLTVAEEELAEELHKIAEGNRAFMPVERPAQNGDKVTVNFVGTIGGTPFEGGTAEGVELTLGEGRFIPGFEEQLVGTSQGEDRTVTVTFPDEYPAKELAGKEASFQVTVTAVMEPQEAAVDDALAERLGLDNLQALRDALRKQMQSAYDKALRERTKRSLLDALDDRFRFDLPAKLVDSEFETIFKQVQTDLEQSGRTADDEGGEEKLREEYRTIAERRVRLGLLLSEIGTNAKVEVTDEEVRQAIGERLRQFPGQEREVIEYYNKTPQAVAALRAPIFEDKVVDYVLELVTVTEKPVTKGELMADAEEGHHHDHDHSHDHDQ